MLTFLWLVSGYCLTKNSTKMLFWCDFGKYFLFNGLEWLQNAIMVGFSKKIVKSCKLR